MLLSRLLKQKKEVRIKHLLSEGKHHKWLRHMIININLLEEIVNKFQGKVICVYHQFHNKEGIDQIIQIVVDNLNDHLVKDQIKVKNLKLKEWI